MMLRTMWCRKALASKSKRQYAPWRPISIARSVFTGDAAWHSAERNALKSCSPIRCRAAASIAPASRLRKLQPTRPASSAGRTGDSRSR